MDETKLDQTSQAISALKLLFFNMAPSKPRQAYSEEDLQKAVNAIKEDGISFGDGEKIYKVPRGTIHKYSKLSTVKIQKPGPDPVMTEDEEDVIKVWCLELSKRGFPVTDDDLLNQVQRIVIADGRETPFKDGRPTYGWLHGFLKRHKEIK